MSDFAPAVAIVLQHEGGYTPPSTADPGGETKFGISKRAYPDVDIRSLTQDQAAAIYQRDYWKYAGVQSQAIANKLLDMAVNMGPSEAHKLLQRILGTYFAGPVVPDGKFGPTTQELTNRIDEVKLINELRAKCAMFYCDIVISKPDQRVFLLGWLRRAVA
jgi:lysozyme family protein